LRTFFGTKWFASGPSRNLREFWSSGDHFWSGCIALALVTGTGMGLRICCSIAEAPGGRLWVVDSFTRGASFHFALPTSSEAHE
jgi:signal transduction histidine kinase